MQIKFSIYFTNHLDQIIKIDKNIVDVEDGILEVEINKLFNTLTFTTNGVYYEPSIINDLMPRIEVKYQLDENEPISEFFVLDGVDYLLENNIKVYAKSEGVRYTYKYGGNVDKLMQVVSVKDLLMQLLPTMTLDFNNFTDIPLVFDYEIKNKSIEEVVHDLSRITMFEYYYDKGVLYFEDKRVIKVDDVEVARFTSVSDIMEFNTTTNKDDKKVNKILINETQTDILSNEPTITLDLRDSPQPCSPDEVIIYEDENTTYKLSPVNAYYIVYFSPTLQLPEINMECENGDRILIERYTLESDNYVKLTGGIDEIIAIEGVTNYNFEIGYNLLTFDNVAKGELKITYRTKVLHGSIIHQKYPRDLNITIKHFNQKIEHIHKTALNGYYPIPYDFTLNLVSDWGIDYAQAIEGEVQISIYEDESPNVLQTKTVSLFGELDFKIEVYGTYRFDKDGQDTLFLDWYINKKRFYLHEVKQW